MRVLAVTCYTGGRELADMTNECVESLARCCPDRVDLKIVVLGQGVSAGDGLAYLVSYAGCLLSVEDENRGFAYGMNAAIELGHARDPDYVLCFNNDLEFPDPHWLRILLEFADCGCSQIVVPATDRTALYKQAGPENRLSFATQEASAYCWLVPFAWCQYLKKEYGWWLFDPEFFAYGEDNWTAFLLSKAFGPKIFRMVPRSFVRHLRHQTSSQVKVDRKQSNRLLVDRLQRELQNPKLRWDLREWATRYIKILKT